jgi:hypothetical protein
MLVQFKPGTGSPVHHTDTWDFHSIVSGSIDLLLDDGPQHLIAGDCVAVMGIDHGWLAGPDGCITSVMSIGTPPPAGTAGDHLADSRG